MLTDEHWNLLLWSIYCNIVCLLFNYICRNIFPENQKHANRGIESSVTWVMLDSVAEADLVWLPCTLHLRLQLVRKLVQGWSDSACSSIVPQHLLSIIVSCVPFGVTGKYVPVPLMAFLKIAVTNNLISFLFCSMSTIIYSLWINDYI